MLNACIFVVVAGCYGWLLQHPQAFFFYKKLIKEPTKLKFGSNFQGTGRMLLSMYGCGNGCSFIIATPTGNVSPVNANLCIDQAEI